MRFLNRYRVLILLVGLLSSLQVWGAEVETTAVARAELPRIYRLDGVAEAINRSTVSAQTSGRVTEVNFDVDDYVTQGDVIVVIEDTRQRAGVNEADANLKAARVKRQDALNEYRRIKGVYEKKAVSKAEMDRVTAALQQAEAGVQAAEAALHNAREELDYTRVKAPYNGIVTERFVEVGETVQPGQRLMSGLSLDSMRVTVDVPQNLIATIRAENKAQAKIGDTWVQAEELTIFPVADTQSNTFQVRLRLPEGTKGVFPGMYVKVGFVAGSHTSLVIPLSAVVLRSEVIGVYVVDETGHVQFRHVRLGSPAGTDHVSLLSGLNEGELVAVNPVAAAIELKSQRTAQVHNE